MPPHSVDLPLLGSDPLAVAIRHAPWADLTHGELGVIVAHVAAELGRAGVGRSDVVVAVLSPTAACATVSLGVLGSAILAPVNPALPAPALAEVLTRLAPALVIVDETTEARVRDAVGESGLPIGLVSQRPSGPAGAVDLALPRVAPTAPRPDEPGLPALLLPTSGTTAAAKLVPLSRANLAATSAALVASLGLDASDVVVHCLPMHHIGGLVDVLLAPLAAGGSVVVASPFSAPEVVGLLSTAGPTWLQLAPAMMRELLAEAARTESGLPAHRLRLVRSVSAPLPPAVMARAEQVLGVPVVEIYGMTETAGVITSNPLDDRRAGTVGVPVAARVRVVGDDGQDLPPGRAGEILVHGPGVMSGYLQGGTPGDVVQGWLRTGDLGFIDVDGYLTISGRVKEAVNRGGEMLSPAELDRVLLDHPAIADAAAFGVPHATLGEVLAAMVVPRSDAVVDPDQVRAWVAERLPSSMVPRPLVRCAEIPRVNGKVRRADLAAALLARTFDDDLDAEEFAPEGTLEAEIAELWCGVLGRERMGLHDDFFTVGGDSLRAASVVALLGARTDDIVYASSVMAAPTVAAYAAHLRAHYPRAAARLVGSVPPQTSNARVDDSDISGFRALIADPWRGDPSAPEPGLPGPRAAVILSPPRSGSTLLRSMLAGHPDLFAPPELYLLGYRDLAERARAFPEAQASQLEGLDRAVMAALGTDAAHAREVLSTLASEGTAEVLHLLQRAVAPRMLVDKTPANALSVGTLQRAETVFDEPVYIHLVRQPAAMVASFEEANLGPLWAPRIVGPEGRVDDVHRFTPRQLAELLWITLHENILAFVSGIPDDRVVRVHFEDLVRDPRAALDPVCRVLGVPFDERLLTPYDDASTRMTDGLHRESRMIGDPKFHRHRSVDAEAGTRWQSDVPLVPLSDRAEELAAQLGYADAAVRRVTAGQARLWHLARLDPASPSHVVPIAVRFRGGIDARAWDRALERVQTRHEVLRTTYPSSEGGRPRAVVARPAPVAATHLVVPSEGLEAAVADALRVPFDLEHGPVWRPFVFHVDGDAVILLSVHHIAIDGLSRPILLRDLGEAYAATRAGEVWQAPPPARGFAEVAADTEEREKPRLPADREYWSAALHPPLAPAALPGTPDPGPVRLLSHHVSVHGDPAADVARGMSSTTAAAWLAAVATALHRWTGQRDLLVAIPSAGRHSPEAEAAVGYFTRVIPVRLDLEGRLLAREVVGRAQRALLEAVDHDGLPLQEIAALPGLAGIPLARVLVEFQQVEGDVIPGLDAEPFVVRPPVADAALAVHVAQEPSGTVVVVDADSSVMGQADLEALAASIVDSVRWLGQHPDVAWDEAPRLGSTPSDVARVLVEHPAVLDAVAVLDDLAGTVEAYVILDEERVPTLGELEDHARDRLPAHRRPARLVSLGSFPRRADGSVDVDRLPRGVDRPRRADSVAPRDDIEELIARAWQRVLWTDEEIGIHDSFRDRGGHSLLSVELVSVIEGEWGRRLPPAAMSRLDTVAGLAEVLRSGGGGLDADAPVDAQHLPPEALAGMLAHTSTWRGERHREDALIVGLNTEGGRIPLFWCLQNAPEHEALARWLGVDQPVYAMRSANRVLEKTPANLDALARHYVDEIRSIRPEGPYLVGGNCQAARIAVRVARRLQEHGGAVPLLVSMEKFDPYPYSGPVLLVFGEGSDRNPLLSFEHPEVGYAQYIDGPMWIRYITGEHGHFFEEPNIQSLSGVLTEHLQATTEGRSLPGLLRPRRMPPLPSDAYQARIDVDRPPAAAMGPGEVASLDVVITNTSPHAWPDGEHGGMSVVARWRDSRDRPGPVVATCLLPAAVPAGDRYRAALEVPAPGAAGEWVLEVDMAEQGIAWFSERGSTAARVAVRVSGRPAPWRGWMGRVMPGMGAGADRTKGGR